jgi:putative flippase GtrA
MTGRVSAFVAVGALGLLLQIGAFAWLTMAAGWPYPWATALAVELTVLHNFWWHERWTWRDRTPARDPQRGCRVGDPARSGVVGRLARFHVTTGLTSIAGNLMFTVLSVELLGVHAIVANVVAVGLTSVANFLVADRWVFARRTAMTIAALVVTCSSTSAAELRRETLAAWKRYTAAAEIRVQQARPADAVGREPNGGAIDVPGGTIHYWRGSILVRGVTVAELLDALMHPGTPPPQEDVVESRVLARSNDSLRVYLKLVRRTIITVTYDTEHEVTFRRMWPGLATSQSVATRIAEVGGEDRGFLWRLNSYWRYVEVEGGALVELESLSLSRPVPAIVRPLVMPAISRIARESMTRTLEALRHHVEKM